MRQLSPSDLDRAAHDLGTFLRTLHQTPVDVAIKCGLTAPTRTAREALEAQYRAVREKVFPRLDADERNRIGRRFETFLADPRHFEFSAVLCHGDLSSDHILVDPARGTLTGVIDFGDMQIGDPAGEFTWRAEYGEAFFGKVLEAYAIADDSFAERVDFRIDCLPLSQIAYGVDTNADAEIDEGISWLRRQTSSLTPRRRL
jgi:aminoglycoside 2''-phosphotransferase